MKILGTKKVRQFFKVINLFFLGEEERRSDRRFSYDQHNDGEEQEEIEDIPYKSNKTNQPPGKRVEQRK
jgi:hypothetical protein